MKHEDLDQWIAALRSGEYKQGYHRLCDADDRYCCLGVMIHELYEGHWTKSTYSSLGWSIDDSWLMPSSRIRSELGLDLEMAEKLSELNDDGRSFKWIASYLERNRTKIVAE